MFLLGFIYSFEASNVKMINLSVFALGKSWCTTLGVARVTSGAGLNLAVFGMRLHFELAYVDLMPTVYS